MVSQASSCKQTICRHKWKALYTCVLTERCQESSSLGASASLGVKTSVCTQATIIIDRETNGDATCTCRYTQPTVYGSEPPHKAVLIGVQTVVLQHTCPWAAAFLVPFSWYRSQQLTCLQVGTYSSVGLIYVPLTTSLDYLYT